MDSKSGRSVRRGNIRKSIDKRSPDPHCVLSVAKDIGKDKRMTVATVLEGLTLHSWGVQRTHSGGEHTWRVTRGVLLGRLCW